MSAPMLAAIFEADAVIASRAEGARRAVARSRERPRGLPAAGRLSPSAWGANKSPDRMPAAALPADSRLRPAQRRRDRLDVRYRSVPAMLNSPARNGRRFRPPAARLYDGVDAVMSWTKGSSSIRMFRSPRPLSPDGAAREVLRRCLTGAARPLMATRCSWSMTMSCRGRRCSPRRRSVRKIGQRCWMPFSVSASGSTSPNLWRPNLRDESGNHPVELAVAGNAAWIVTGNERDAAAGEPVFDGFRADAPGAWL